MGLNMRGEFSFTLGAVHKLCHPIRGYGGGKPKDDRGEGGGLAKDDDDEAGGRREKTLTELQDTLTIGM